MISPTLLKEKSPFGGLSEQQLATLAAIAEERSIPAGTVVHRETEMADTLYVILEGRIGIRIEVGPLSKTHQVWIDELQPGEIFGWSALVPPRKLTGSAICREDARVIAIEGDALRAAMESDPALGYQVMSSLTEVIAARLRDTRRQLIDTRVQLAHELTQSTRA